MLYIYTAPTLVALSLSILLIELSCGTLRIAKRSLALASRALLPRTTDRRRLSRVLSTHGRAASATRGGRHVEDAVRSSHRARRQAVSVCARPLHRRRRKVRHKCAFGAPRASPAGAATKSRCLRRSSIIRLVTLFLQNNGKHASPREYQINWLPPGDAQEIQSKRTTTRTTRFTTVRASTVPHVHT